MLFLKHIFLRASISLASQYMLFPYMPVTYQLLPTNPLDILDVSGNFYTPLKEALNNTVNEHQSTIKYDEIPHFNSKESYLYNNLLSLFSEELKEFNSGSFKYNNFYILCK